MPKMRCVSLSTSSLERLFKNILTERDISFFKTKKHDFKLMWKEQGSEFWMKFVIKCKEILGASYNYEHKVDIIFVEFLDVLLCVDFNSVFDYVNNVGKSVVDFKTVSVSLEKKYLETVGLDVKSYQYLIKKIKLQFVAAFIKLMSTWQKAEIGLNIEWIVPNYWENFDGKLENLEMYIKSLYSPNELEQMFSCCKQKIQWLSDCNAECEQDESNVKDIKDDNSELIDEDVRRVVIHGDGRLACIQPTFEWIPIQMIKRKARHESEIGNIELLRKSNNNMLRIWELVETSLPQVLALRYHINDTTNLKVTDDFCHFMGTSAIFAMWDKTFGLQLLYHINDKQSILQDMCSKDSKIAKNDWNLSTYVTNVEDWRSKVDHILFVNDSAKRLKDSPTSNDIATKSSELLLEPCIIHQLPWNCTLFHQWLTAALVEVLTFEHKSIELRHWSVPNPISFIAIDLMNLVKNLKERIILGFVILSRKVTLYPDQDTQLPFLIMNQVILPSLSTLEFLITGKAFQVLKNIKIKSWSKDEEIKDRIYINSDVYTIDLDLHDFFISMCYHFMFWEYLHIKKPFPGDIFDETKIKQIINRINEPIKNYVTTENIKEFSKEEKFICKIVEKKDKALGRSDSEKTNLAISIVTENVLEKKRVENISIGDINKNLNTKEIKELSRVIYTKVDEKNITNHFLLCSLMYKELYTMLLGSEKERSILSRIISMQLEILEREQIVRLTNIISLKCNATPVAINVVANSLSTSELFFLIKEVEQKKIVQQSCNWLLQQFNKYWQADISKSKVVFESFNNMNVQLFVSLLSGRIGKLIYNIAKNAFIVYELSGVYFKYMHIVQYILPCLISSFIVCVNKPIARNRQFHIFRAFQTFLTEVISYFEEKFEIWKSHKIEKSVVDEKILNSNTPVKRLVSELLILGEFYRSSISNMLRVCICELNPSDAGLEIGILHGMCNIDAGLQEYTNILILKEHITEDEEPFIKTWSSNALEYFTLLYNICCEVWQMPTTNIVLNNSSLENIYQSDISLQAMELVYHMLTGYSTEPEIEGMTNLATLNSEWAKEQEYWRLNIIKRVTSLFKQFSESDLKYFTQKVDLFKSYYRMLQISYQSSNIDPNSLNFFENIPDAPKGLKLAALLFLHKNYTELDNIAPLLGGLQIQKCEIAWQENTNTKKEEEKGESSKTRKKKKSKKQCNNCGKFQSRRKRSFLTCEKCIEEHYPAINYYCSVECKDMWWKVEHMAEHLEFELGLGEFSDVHGKKH
jgi:hypothetical protein